MDSFTDMPAYFRLLASLGLVLGLMGGLAILLKKLGVAGQAVSAGSGQKRLKVVESLPLDARRRLVLIQRDDAQHLIILGHEGETLIETGIKAPENASSEGFSL